MAYRPGTVPLTSGGFGGTYDGRTDRHLIASWPMQFQGAAPIHTSAPRNDSFTHMFQTRPLVPDNEASNLKLNGARNFLAYMFTLSAFAIFVAPVVISISLASDYDVNFWIGRWGYLAILVPIFLTGQHLYHLWMLQNNKLTRYLFILTPLLPAALFMFIGGTYMSYGRFLYGQLRSDDCAQSSMLPAKFWLQEAYDEAYNAREKCLVRKKSENFDQPLRRYHTLQSCDEWEVLIKNAKTLSPWKGYKIPENSIRVHDPSNIPRWQYLANSELNHICSSFCSRGPALWTNTQKLGHDGAACAPVIAFRFLSVIQSGLMVFTIGAIVFVLTFPIYFSTRGFLGSMGYSSSTALA